jgi:hypothetical protein
METKNFEDTTLQYNQEFDKFKKEGQEYVEQLTFELERKIKNLEERLKTTEMAKRVGVGRGRTWRWRTRKSTTC